MSVLLSVLVGVLAAYILIYYSLFKGARFNSNVTLKGKTAIVTGSNTGIGKATALDLAKRGARVFLACRNKEKAEAAVYDIRKESGNPEVLYMHLDLASLKSVRNFAETFLKSEPRLDLLINSAGLIASGRTEDGFGMAFGVNYLEHSRVINVADVLHRLGSVDFILLNTHKHAEGCAYCHSKLCNVLFTRELANRLEGTSVTCYCLHPGAIATEIDRNMGVLQKLLLLPMSKLFFLDPEGGAQTTLYCALQEGLEPLSGWYFSSCALQNVSAHGRDDALAKKLWEVSERLCGLS
uniref:Dehydrogenase/reductase (SDR family) member 13a, duplicate 3 n=1 Tax=Sinocyclocheilus anshuiensis TaxID=1608454 RepID=A0A671N581_9TELE